MHILKIVKSLLDIGGNIYPKPRGSTAKTDLKSSSYRLVFGKREQILCILALLHGNCRFPDRHQLFSTWARKFLDQNLELMRARLLKKLEYANKFQKGGRPISCAHR